MAIDLASKGSGSTYVYGYCDATYRDGWGRDETVNFVKNSKYIHKYILSFPNYKSYFLALALAMSRDGSSGGVIRMCVVAVVDVAECYFGADWGEGETARRGSRTAVGDGPFEGDGTSLHFSPPSVLQSPLFRKSLPYVSKHACISTVRILPSRPAL